MGCTPVDQAKGIETVKDAIRRLQFSQQMKKAESGSNIKTKKVEITISVDGVAIQVSILLLFFFFYFVICKTIVQMKIKLLLRSSCAANKLKSHKENCDKNMSFCIR